jgi:outer membrane biosynthesis protein TonB
MGALPAPAQTVEEVQVAPPRLRMRPGAETQVVATAYDVAGNPVQAQFQWTTSNINVVEVSADGTLRALAPGTATVTASVLQGGAKKSGRVSVFVMFEPRAPPPPMVPAVPPAPAAPRTPPAVNVDSIIRASVNCADPMINAVNPARACWDRRALVRTEPRVAAPPACGRRSLSIQLLILVSPRGEADSVQFVGTTMCPEFEEAVQAWARSARYEPARRGDAPVASWLRMMVRAIR